MIATCPSNERLQQYLLGQLNDEQSDLLFGHLSDCEDCQLKMGKQEPADDSLIGDLRAVRLDTHSSLAVDVTEFAAEPGCQAAMNRAFAALDQSQQHENSTQLPETIGDYQIMKCIGRGGMGSVYLARHKKLGRDVALKVISGHRLNNPNVQQRFESEMLAVGRLSHPNIVNAYDAREVDGLAVLVTEFVNGLDLGEIIRRTGPLSVANSCEVVSRVADALTLIDEKQLVHRDIKPSNIMINRDGEVKLLDLGLARIQQAEAGHEFTATGQTLGTADYVSPEQVNDGRNVDIRTDIYSLGCTLFKLLTGRAPFADERYPTAFAKMTAHVSEVPPSISEIVADIPVDLNKLVCRMLDKSPDLRPQFPQEVQRTVVAFSPGSDLKTLVKTAMESPVRFPGSFSKEPAKQLQQSPSSLFKRPVPFFIALAAGLIGILFGCLFGIIITIKRPDGTTTQVEVPDGSRVTVDENGNAEIELPGPGKAISPNSIPSDSIVDIASRSNLRSLLVAAHRYHDDEGQLPGSSIISNETKHPHSWRVALLPYIGRRDLHMKYRFDEPWDSDNNRKLLEQMPDEFRRPDQPRDNYFTSYVGFSGKDTALTGVSFEQITDGTVQTILFIEAETNIPWTKPEDYEFGAVAFYRLPNGGDFLNAVTVDGSVHRLPTASLDRKILDQLIKINDGSTLRMEDLKSPNTEASKTETENSDNGQTNTPQSVEKPEILKDRGLWLIENVEVIGGVNVDFEQVPNIFLAGENQGALMCGSKVIAIVPRIDFDLVTFEKWTSQKLLNKTQLTLSAKSIQNQNDGKSLVVCLMQHFSSLNEERLKQVEDAMNSNESFTNYLNENKWIGDIVNELPKQVPMVRAMASPDQTHFEGVWKMVGLRGGGFDRIFVLLPDNQVHVFSGQMSTNRPMELKGSGFFGLDSEGELKSFKMHLKDVRDSWASTDYGIYERLDDGSIRMSMGAHGRQPTYFATRTNIWDDDIFRLEKIELPNDLSVDLVNDRPEYSGIAEAVKLYLNEVKQNADASRKTLTGLWQLRLTRNGNAISGTRGPDLFLFRNNEVTIYSSNMEMAVGEFETKDSERGMEITLKLRPPGKKAGTSPTSEGTFWAPEEMRALIETHSDDSMSLNIIKDEAESEDEISMHLERVELPQDPKAMLELALNSKDHNRYLNAIAHMIRASIGDAPLDKAMEQKLDRFQSIQNLRKLAFAAHTFHDTHKSLPASRETRLTVLKRKAQDQHGPPTDDDEVTQSKHPHSWRVALLPFLGHTDLYEQYQFDEAWDSEANLKVLAQMPDVYRHPGRPKGTTDTSYVGFVGSLKDNKELPCQTALGLEQGIRLEDFQDGTSRSILFVESNSLIPWTEPDDLNFDPTIPPEVESFDNNFLNTAFADGSVHSIYRERLSSEVFGQLLCVNDGSTPDIESLESEEEK